MDGLIKSSLNKIKSFAGNVIKQAPQAFQNYANTYSKVAPYVPFAPKVTTPQVRQENFNSLKTNIQDFTSGFQNPLGNKVGQSFSRSAGAYLGAGAPEIGPIVQGTNKLVSFIPNAINLAREQKFFTGVQEGNMAATEKRIQSTPQLKNNPLMAEGERFITNYFTGGIMAGVTTKNPLGGFKKEQIETVRKGFSPEVRKIVGEFARQVEENPKGINRKNLGPLGEYIDSLAQVVFGKQASNLNNRQLKNAFDLIMEQADRGPGMGQFSVGLATKNAREESQKVKVVNGKIKVKATPPSLEQPVINPNEYMAEQIRRQREASAGEKVGFMAKVKGVGKSFKRIFVESYAPLIDPVNEYARKNKVEIRPSKNIDDQISRVLASDTIATRWLKDNGLEGVVEQDLDELGQYLIARDHMTGAARQGKITGRNLKADIALVKNNAARFEEKANVVTKMFKSLAQMAEDEGMLAPGTVAKLSQENPNYVRWERIFSPDEMQNIKRAGKGVASISKQTTVQAMKGSERAIENPLVTVINRAYKTINEIERNKAAKILTDYRTIPGNPYGLRLLAKNETIGAKNTISVFRNGIKEIWEVNKDVAEAAKNLNKEQMPVWARIINLPTRIFKAGTTTLRIPFVASNVARDQMTAFINSDRAASTSLLNPRNAIESIFEAVKHGDTFRKMEQSGAMGTSFDIYRESPKITLEALRSNKNLKSKVLYKITHPNQILRSYENILSRGEEFTRIQQFKGTYDQLIREGRTHQDATILAARASRQNTVDFARYGDLSRVLNWFIPYFNAGIQGSRSFLRAAQKNPAAVGAKLTAAVFMPMVASTLWNTATPDRKTAYDDIQDWEKETNFIIIPPNPKKDENGRWMVYKIPLSQEIANLANISRLYTLQAAQGEKVAASAVARDLIGTTTSLDIENPMSQLTPQFVKPGVEVALNRNLYTGKEIVPSNMRNLEPEDQVYKTTSATMRALGKATNQSPLKVQHLVKGYGGATATDIVGGIDSGLAAMGKVPKEQAKGMDVMDATAARFTRAIGGDTMDKSRAKSTEKWSPRLTTAYDYLHSPKTLDENGLPSSNRQESMAFAQIRLANPEILAREAQEARVRAQVDGTPVNPLYNLPYDKQRAVLLIASLPPGEDKSALQKENISWLKPYWEDVSAYFSRVGSQPKAGLQAPKASPYVQAQMDAGNWKDPQVQEYLNANTAYKNEVRAQLGLPPLEGGFSKFPAYQKKPKKVAIGSVKKGKSVKLKAIKLPKVKKLAKVKFNFKVKASKQPKIKVKMPRA